jgi:hypothetical protein
MCTTGDERVVLELQGQHREIWRSGDANTEGYARVACPTADNDSGDGRRGRVSRDGDPTLAVTEEYDPALVHRRIRRELLDRVVDLCQAQEPDG